MINSNDWCMQWSQHLHLNYSNLLDVKLLVPWLVRLLGQWRCCDVSRPFKVLSKQAVNAQATADLAAHKPHKMIIMIGVRGLGRMVSKCLNLKS